MKNASLVSQQTVIMALAAWVVAKSFVGSTGEFRLQITF